MKVMRTVLLVLIFSTIVYSQVEVNKVNEDEDPMLYFPHKEGDMWEYFIHDWGIIMDTVQIKVVLDSLDAEGIHHVEFSRKSISDVNVYNNYIKIDTAYNVYQDGFLKFRLDAQIGDQWVAYTYGDSGEFGYEIVRVNDEHEEIFFGVLTNTKSYLNYYSIDSTDTIGLTRYGEGLAYGFGMIGRSDGFDMYYLRGCIINGIKYGTVTSVKDLSENNPNDFNLSQNYPNPFNPTTVISYQLSAFSNVKLTVYDILGKEIITLVNEEKQLGTYEAKFDATSLSSGIYFYRLQAGSFVETKKMILVR